MITTHHSSKIYVSKEGQGKHKAVRGWPQSKNAATIPAGIKERFKVVCNIIQDVLKYTIHNLMVIYQSLQGNNKNDCLTFRIQLIKGPTEEQYLNLYTGTHQLNQVLNNSLNVIFWRGFLPPERSLNCRDSVQCAHNTEEKERVQWLFWFWSWLTYDWLLQELPYKSKHMIKSFDKLKPNSN
jgi:hypothetical protein